MHFGGGDCNATTYCLCVCVCVHSVQQQQRPIDFLVTLANLTDKRDTKQSSNNTRNLHSVTFYISNEAYPFGSKQYFVEWNGMELKWKPIGNLIEGCQSGKLNGWCGAESMSFCFFCLVFDVLTY